MLTMTKEDLRKLAEEVRDLAHHAATCAPVHGKTPEELIMQINLDSILDKFNYLFDEEEEEDLTMCLCPSTCDGDCLACNQQSTLDRITTPGALDRITGALDRITTKVG